MRISIAEISTGFDRDEPADSVSVRFEHEGPLQAMMKIDKTLDARGLAGPRASTLTMHILETMHTGQVLRLITDDMRSRQSIPLMCETCGYHLINRTEDGGILSFIIQKHGIPDAQEKDGARE